MRRAIGDVFAAAETDPAEADAFRSDSVDELGRCSLKPLLGGEELGVLRHYCLLPAESAPGDVLHSHSVTEIYGLGSTVKRRSWHNSVAGQVRHSNRRAGACPCTLPRQPGQKDSESVRCCAAPSHSGVGIATRCGECAYTPSDGH
jgi:hypothetical protein